MIRAVGFETRSHGVRGDSEIYGGVYKVFASGWLGTLVTVDDSAESVDECDFMESVNLRLIIPRNTNSLFLSANSAPPRFLTFQQLVSDENRLP